MEETSRLGVGCSVSLDGSRRSIFPNDLRYQILADDGAERDVGNWDADDKANDLNELSRLRNGSSTGTDECGCETADDQRNEPRAANSYDKKEQPRFEVRVTLPDLNDSLIPCGYYKVVSGSLIPSCGTGIPSCGDRT